MACRLYVNDKLLIRFDIPLNPPSKIRGVGSEQRRERNTDQTHEAIVGSRAPKSLFGYRVQTTSGKFTNPRKCLRN